MISPARRAWVAAAAALFASGGDLLLLHVANSGGMAPGLAVPAGSILWVGGVMGVVAIPLYAVGYASASSFVAGASRRGASLIWLSGLLGSLLGSVIHGATAFHIGKQLGTAVPQGDPMAFVAASPLLLALWGLAAAAVLIASATFGWCVARGESTAPRSAALGNPALMTVVLVCCGLPFALGRAYLVPAAPNLAHLVFFIVCFIVCASLHGRASERSESRGGR